VKHYIRIGLLAALTVVLAACQDPAPSLTFEGTSTIAGNEHSLALAVERHGDRLSGEYMVEGASGSFNGSVDGTAVIAELLPSATCSYSFAGTLTDSSLQGSFEPSDCPGGQLGTWSLARK